MLGIWPFQPAADIWSLGCLAFELVTGDTLFDPQLPEGVDESALDEGDFIKDESHLQQCLELEKREHRRTTAKLRQLLDRKDKGGGDEGGGALSSGENQAMQDALQLMRLYEKQVHAMQAMLHDVGDSEMDGEVRELHRQLANLQAQQGASKLESLLSVVLGLQGAVTPTSTQN